MRNLSFILGVVSAIVLLEGVFRLKADFSPPLTENNSFILKKEAFDDYLAAHAGDLRAQTIFIGSSFFARGIACEEMADLPCLNLSMDGGDARSFEQTYRRLLQGRHPKRIVFELTPIVFADYDYSGPAIKGYLETPVDHLHGYLSTGLTANFKQALKNQVDALLIDSGLNYFSRRNRFSEWPRLVWSPLNPEAPKPAVALTSEVAAYFRPNPKKLATFLTLVNDLGTRGIPVFVIATPERFEGQLDSPRLQESEAYQVLAKLQSEKKLTFISNLTKRGLPESALGDELNHLAPSQLGLFAKILKRELEGPK